MATNEQNGLEAASRMKRLARGQQEAVIGRQQGQTSLTAVDGSPVATYIRPIGMKAAGANERIPEPRRSVSASASLKAEIQRVSQMSVEERIRAALGMKQHFSSLRPIPSEG